MAWIYKGKKYTDEELAGIIPEVYTREDYRDYIQFEPYFADDDRKEIMEDFEEHYLAMVEVLAIDMINACADIYDYGIEYVE